MGKNGNTASPYRRASVAANPASRRCGNRPRGGRSGRRETRTPNPFAVPRLSSSVSVCVGVPQIPVLAERWLALYPDEPLPRELEEECDAVIRTAMGILRERRDAELRQSNACDSSRYDLVPEGSDDADD